MRRGSKILFMARLVDTGPYAVGNVKICTNRENVAEIKISEEDLHRRRITALGNTYGFVNKGRPFSEEYKSNLKVACKLREARKRQARILGVSYGDVL